MATQAALFKGAKRNWQDEVSDNLRPPSPVRPVVALGDRFGMLVVLRELPERRQNNRVYECRCDCGNITRKRSRDLKHGQGVSCGCQRKANPFGRNAPGMSSGYSHRHYWTVARRGAKKRGIAFELSPEDFAELRESACAYCGSTERVGVDRIDPSDGYVRANVQACCWTCNLAKASQEHSDFVAWVKRAHDHLAAKGVFS